MKKMLACFLSFFILYFLTFQTVSAQTIDPQYIFVRKNNMQCNPSDCSQLWNMNNPNLDYSQGITDVLNKVATRGTNQRKLGIGVLVYYNEYNFDNVKNSLQKLLNDAKTQVIPVFLALDGFQWWDTRADLWNWWDQNQQGFNPNNKNNVEWTCDNSSCATNKTVRNWGTEFEIKPLPNLASRVFIQDSKQRLAVLIPIIINWYNGLPDDKKWLLGGVSLGTEVAVDYTKTAIGGNTVQIGYAAIRTLGLSGGITSNNLNEVIRRYVDELDQYAIALGIPRNKIFNHTGGTGACPQCAAPPNIISPDLTAAVSNHAYPGWSFYGDVTSNPQNYPVLSAALDRAGNSQWASLEWLPYATDYNGWVLTLRNTLNYRNNKFLNVANWENVRDKQYVLDAIRTVLNENPPIPSPTPTRIPTSTPIPTPTPTRAPTPTQAPTYLQGDINRDGKVDISDYNLLVSDFGKTNVSSDINNDGKVDIFDYNILVGNFGRNL